MLVLTRKVNESIMVGQDVEIRVLEIKGDQVKIGVAAPKAITVHRKEVYDAIASANKSAAGTIQGLKNLQLPALPNHLPKK